MGIHSEEEGEEEEKEEEAVVVAVESGKEVGRMLCRLTRMAEWAVSARAMSQKLRRCIFGSSSQSRAEMAGNRPPAGSHATARQSD